jgi:hypothetical protein
LLVFRQRIAISADSAIATTKDEPEQEKVYHERIAHDGLL